MDVIVKSKVCKACKKWIGREESDEFKRSTEWFGVKYKKYAGDGDSKTFKNLLEADFYSGNPENIN